MDPPTPEDLPARLSSWPEPYPRPEAVAPAPAPTLFTGPPGTLPAVTLSFADIWQQAVDRVLPQAATPATLWPALVLVALALAWPDARRWGRTLTTLVHEAGHAGVGILVGRRFLGFTVAADLSGQAVTSGRPHGPGRVATTWAGYPMPALIGAGFVTAALYGWAGAVLAVGLMILVVLLVMSRSLRTVLTVLAVLAATAALWWLAGPWRAGVLAGVGLVLLLGAWGSLGDVARSRDRHQDHGTLAGLTHVPAGVWLVSWFLVDGLATAAAAWAAYSVLAGG